MAEGHSNQAISDLLTLSPRTVERHIAHIFAKLDLADSDDHHRRVLAVLEILRT
jgi:DNA-binding NarL/FixJ family response regulator